MCGKQVTQVIQGPFCGDFFGFPPTFPQDIAEDGTVVGFYNVCLAGPSLPFVWSEADGFVTLDLPDGFTEGGAAGIDEQTGWIVGSVDGPGTDGPFAAVWQGGVPVVLGTLPGGNFSDAWAVSAGVVVGRWGNDTTGDPGQQAFVWTDQTMIDLSADLGTLSGRAQDVNAAGQVTGWMGTAIFSDARAFVWADHVVTELPPIPGGSTSIGEAISGPGHVVGWGGTPSGNRAFYWDGNKMLNLGTLPGFVATAAFDLTDARVAVGTATGGGQTGFVYSDGAMRDLNDLIPPGSGVIVRIAYAINSAGQIAARGHETTKGDIVGILLTPIEPPPGDLTCDGEVGEEDFWLLLDNWGPCPAQEECPGDLDGDGSVGIVDFLMLLANWG